MNGFTTMQIRIASTFLFITIIGLMAFSCVTSEQSASTKREAREYYTSSFPDRNISSSLENIQRSIKRIVTSATYQTFYMGDQLIIRDQIDPDNLRSQATRVLTSTENTAGTAIALYSSFRGKIALLTCAHVVDFPDTLITYREEDRLPPNTYVRSVTVKQLQTNFIYDLPDVGEFEIVDMDQDLDLALLEVDQKEFDNLNLPTLPLQLGDSRQLRLGSFLYILGYPKGYTMVTKGIVSNPNRTADGDFLTDALFNPGISGGLIIANRGDYPAFEWVGMANTASATSEFSLIPNPVLNYKYETPSPYPDTLATFVHEYSRLSYGITMAIPMQKIAAFMQRQERYLKDNRYHMKYDFSAVR
ncbi:MAG: serine protease [Balneolaceae bacterium]|nr:serine protease [Balneolaceae bacterium]